MSGRDWGLVSNHPLPARPVRRPGSAEWFPAHPAVRGADEPEDVSPFEAFLWGDEAPQPVVFLWERRGSLKRAVRESDMPSMTARQTRLERRDWRSTIARRALLGIGWMALVASVVALAAGVLEGREGWILVAGASTAALTVSTILPEPLPRLRRVDPPPIFSPLAAYRSHGLPAARRPGTGRSTMRQLLTLPTS